jgi:hypothetical protein
MPTVKFNGGGTFPVTADRQQRERVDELHGNRSRSRPPQCLQLGEGNVNVTGDAGGVNGDVLRRPERKSSRSREPSP